MEIRDSIDAVLDSKEDLGKVFYDTFINQYPEVQEYFADTDMKRQSALLTTALIIVERYYSSPNPAVEQYLQFLGTKHYDKKIPKELYAQWSLAMLQTLSQFHGDEWDEGLAAQWREAIQVATELMFDGYDTRYHV